MVKVNKAVALFSHLIYYFWDNRKAKNGKCKID